MSDPREGLYLEWFDPITSPLPVPETELIDGCDAVDLSISRKWWYVLEACLRRLEYFDAWQGTEEEKIFATQEIARLLERLAE